ncbi:Integrator complex subunit 14 [Schistosoma japonicum]|nr:Integrator complex subunit 14 [Schistosoma japonicum]KAH8856339.1 Integrator complex subunit 14 [Schistosoma japonicum]
MIRLVIIDRQLRMLRPHEHLTLFSYSQLLCMLAKSVVIKLCSLENAGFVSVCDTSLSSSKGLLGTFSSDASSLCNEISHIEKTAKLFFPSESTATSVLRIVKEVYFYYGPWSDIQVLLFTDGGSSYFTNSSFTWPVDFPESLFNDLSILFISLNNKSLSNDLMELYNKFQLKSTILEGSKYISDSKICTTDLCIDNLAKHIIEQCQSDQETPKVIINCGRLQGRAVLLPSPGVRSFTGISDLAMGSLFVEIFGFLNLSDLNNPPVNGRFTVISRADSSDPDLLYLLLGALQSTKTAAMCNIYLVMTNRSLDSNTVQEPDSNISSKHQRHPHNQQHQSLKNSLNRTLWSHGYLHHIDVKQPILLLSVFERECTGLPWLGQFSHLAPVTDFAGSQLYDDRNDTSPFPVRTPDHLSYKIDSSRYVSWSSQSAMLSDIIKVLRLSRRLPDKSALLYKELNRLRSAATIYGCPELLTQIHSMIMSIHQSNINQDNCTNSIVTTNNDQMKSLQTCLNNVSEILLLQQEVYTNDDILSPDKKKIQ